MSQIGTAETTQPGCNEDGNGLIEGYAEPGGLDRLVVVLYAAENQPDILIDQSPQTKEGEDENSNDEILFNPSARKAVPPRMFNASIILNRIKGYIRLTMAK
jgi:hypothetical protein